jgi:hypothetical protein
MAEAYGRSLTILILVRQEALMLQAKKQKESAHSNKSIKTGGEEMKWSSFCLWGKVRVPIRDT